MPVALGRTAARFLSFACLGAAICGAEEGMWTFDNPPLQQLKERYNFTPTKQWLDHLRLSCVRLNDGGSGSFVSPHGLLLTNHHVARGQLQKNSTSARDYLKNGFYARTEAEEMKSQDLEVNVLVSMEDVTARVSEVVKNAETPEKAFAARRAITAEIARDSEETTGLRSDVVTLYQGGEYWLYRYKRYTDVRLVFAPEQQIAFFGGDPDNFTYPRYDLDFAIFRVYENGKPIDSKDYLSWRTAGATDEELVFVAGHPGSTSRLDTMAQLWYERDTVEPNVLKLIKHRIAVLTNYSSQGAEQAREAESRIFYLQNSLKVYQGRYKGLLDPAVMGKKEQEEEQFKAAVMANPEWKKAYGGAWEAIAEAEKKAATRTKEEFFTGLDSELADFAREIVEYVAEIKKPDGERLDGYHDAQLESLKFELASPAPIYKRMEIARMTGALQQDMEENGSDPYLQLILNGKPPGEVANALVNGTQLADPSLRKKLMDGGESAVAACRDPMIILARELDPIRRERIKWKEDNVESVEKRGGEELGKARFLVYGKSTYPDGTFTLRLSYGQVKGYPMNGTKAPYKTTLYGLYDRANGFDFKGPFFLPPRYSDGRNELDLATPLDFVTTNDTTGGNSGSPVVNRSGEIVGLIFDGNIESLVGDFVYDGETNRTVSVHTAAITETLKKLYGAQALMDEIEAGSK